jgi:hypothetical protein
VRTAYWVPEQVSSIDATPAPAPTASATAADARPGGEPMAEAAVPDAGAAGRSSRRAPGATTRPRFIMVRRRRIRIGRVRGKHGVQG